MIGYRLPPFPGDRLRRSSGAKRRAKAGQRRGRKQADRYDGISQTWLSACFLPRLCPAFALPGNSLDDIGQTGGDCLFYGSKPVCQNGSRGFERPENLPLGWFSAKSGPEGPSVRRRGLAAPEKPALGLVFSEKRAGRPRKKSPGEELESEELSNVFLAALNSPFVSWLLEHE